MVVASPTEVPLPLRRLTPVPADGRPRGAGRVRQINFRLFGNKWVEHRVAAEFLSRVPDAHGERQDALIRALYAYYVDVVLPAMSRDPLHAYAVTERRFTLLPAAAATGSPKLARNHTLRLYVDRYVEHRVVAQWLDAQRDWGRGVETVVAAICHYASRYGSYYEAQQ